MTMKVRTETLNKRFKLRNKVKKHPTTHTLRSYQFNYIIPLQLFIDLLQKTIQDEGKKYKEHYVKPNTRDYVSIQNGNRPDSSYIRETIEIDKEKRQPARTLPPISKVSSQNGPASHEGILISKY